MSQVKTFTNEEIAITDIPHADTLTFTPLEQRYRTVLMLAWFGIMGSVIVFNLIVNAYTGSLIKVWEHELLPVIGLGVFAISFAGFFAPHIVWQSKGFCIRTHDIHYKHGVIWQSVTSLPFARIQHVELESGPIERFFKLTTLKFYSAGGGSADMKIPGLSFGIASQIRSIVMRRVDSASDKTAEDTHV